MLTKEQILAADDFKVEVVNVPEWGGEVLVRTISGIDRDSYEADCLEFTVEGDLDRAGSVRTRVRNARALLAVRCICDESGHRLFADADAEELGQKCAAALDRIWDVAGRLNRISESNVEELAKNSEAAGGGGSSAG